MDNYVERKMDKTGYILIDNSSEVLLEAENIKGLVEKILEDRFRFGGISTSTLPQGTDALKVLSDSERKEFWEIYNKLIRKTI